MVPPPAMSWPRLLGAAQQHVQGRVQILLHRARDRDHIRQVAFGRCFLADLPEEAEEGATGVGSGGTAACVVDQVLDPGRDHRLEQFLFGREVAVHGAWANPGASGDLIEGHAVPARGERFPRCHQDLFAVAQGIRPRGALSHNC